MEFDGKRGLSNVTFEILEGEIMGIIEHTGGEMNIGVGDEWVDMTKPRDSSSAAGPRATSASCTRSTTSFPIAPSSTI